MRLIIGCSEACQAIGQFKDGFRRARLVGVDRGVEIVNDARTCDEAIGGGGVRLARIGERSGRRLQAFQMRDPLFVGDREQDDVAALFGTPDGK